MGGLRSENGIFDLSGVCKFKFIIYMNLIKKIEEIRRQPEHVRMRYVWLCVAVSMACVVALWFFSMASMFSGMNENTENSSSVLPDLSEQLEQFKNSANSLKDLQQPLGSEEGLSVQSEQFKDDISEDIEGISESASYSSIGNVDEQ